MSLSIERIAIIRLGAKLKKRKKTLPLLQEAGEKRHSVPTATHILEIKLGEEEIIVHSDETE